MAVDVFHRLGTALWRTPGRVSAEQRLWSFPHLVCKVQNKQKREHWKGTNTFDMECRINGLTRACYPVERLVFKGCIPPQPSLIKRVRVLSHSEVFCMKSVPLILVAQSHFTWKESGGKTFCLDHHSEPGCCWMTNMQKVLLFFKCCSECGWNWPTLGPRKWF